jgi:amino acid transporter
LIGVPVVAVVALTMPFLHFGAVALAPLLAVIHLVAARWYLVGESLRLLGRTRRQFNRWLARFSFLWVGVPGYAAMVTPLLGILVGAATFAGLTSIVHLYARWSLEQEHRRLPLLTWEKTLMTVLAVATLLLVAILVALAAAMGWSVAALSQWISSDP